jgi:hypothetical protein
MRFAGVKELKHNTMGLLEDSKNEDIVVTAYGKPVAILHHIDEDDLADYLIENDPRFRKGIEEAFLEYETSGGITSQSLIRKLEKRGGTKKV